LRNGECIGFVRSTAFGFSIGKQIAYGYVDTPEGKPLQPKEFNAWLKEGIWSIGDRCKSRPARFQMKAPFDPSNARIKGEYSTFTSLRPDHPLDALMKEEKKIETSVPSTTTISATSDKPAATHRATA